MLRRTGFPVDEIWQGGLFSEPEDEDDIDECPQEQIMTVKQTSPTLSAGKLFDEERVDLDSNTVIRPTLQAVLWLSELLRMGNPRMGEDAKCANLFL